MKPRIAFKTLGCRLNQFETDALVSQFARNGYEIVGFDNDPDICIVNTCTVTNQGDVKSRKAIRQAVKNPGEPTVIVTGCMVNGQKEELQKMNGVRYFVENATKSSIFEIVEAHRRGETVDMESYRKDVFSFEPARQTLHTRSFIKIQDGCDNFCTFCIVPRVRGRAISRPADDIIENVKQVVDFGYKELILTGVNLGRYQHDGLDFEHLAEKILEVPGDFRVRISSIEPEGFGDHLFGLFDHPKLMPHLHLCLQSGSDRILLKMRRFYTVDTYLNMIDKVRKKYPGLNLTTDIIVGFPGETEEDFQESLKIVNEVGFSHVHTFKYSVRSGTRAARLDEQVPEKVKEERSRVIREISSRNKKQYYQGFIGSSQRVLVERHHPVNHVARGYGEHYVPVSFRSYDHDLPNTFRDVVITGVSDGEEPVLLGS